MTTKQFLFSLEILDFFNEFLKKWDLVETTLTVTDTNIDTPCPEAERLVTIYALPVSLKKQPIQILYYLTQL
jgi:hypothetical protein